MPHGEQDDGENNDDGVYEFWEDESYWAWKELTGGLALQKEPQAEQWRIDSRTGSHASDSSGPGSVPHTAFCLYFPFRDAPLSDRHLDW